MQNDTDLLYHHAKYGGDRGSRWLYTKKCAVFTSEAMPVLFLLSGPKMGF